MLNPQKWRKGFTPFLKTFPYPLRSNFSSQAYNISLLHSRQLKIDLFQSNLFKENSLKASLDDLKKLPLFSTLKKSEINFKETAYAIKNVSFELIEYIKNREQLPKDQLDNIAVLMRIWDFFNLKIITR